VPHGTNVRTPDQSNAPLENAKPSAIRLIRPQEQTQCIRPKPGHPLPAKFGHGCKPQDQKFFGSFFQKRTACLLCQRFHHQALEFHNRQCFSAPVGRDLGAVEQNFAA
jgi:hypothetical protein